NRYPEAEIMLIADSTISPMKYLNPQIRPLSLAIKPYSDSELSLVMQEFVSKLLARDDGGIWIDTLSGKVKLAYSSILYLEASNKMISIRQNSMEYSIYGSLEKLEQELPDEFVRCHRSYIVNSKRISKVKFSENYLVLDDGLRLPLSRTCKQAIREVIGRGNSEKEVLS
ncbi:MAG: LytTR family transcriptional regulator DNA-binding domain-containing protein, partial [Lachnospiraceae bacterium]|nr:LytTR family transcriptional regulator DNA-binding domain-containing protein [Lachnospiraceae bacterium]